MPQRLTAVAFYRPVKTRVRTAGRKPVNLSVAVASAMAVGSFGLSWAAGSDMGPPEASYSDAQV